MSKSINPEPSEITNTVAGNIRMALALKRLSMRDVATAAGISVATLSRIASGQKDIGLEQLKLIADATGTDFRSLLDRAL